MFQFLDGAIGSKIFEFNAGLGSRFNSLMVRLVAIITAINNVNFFSFNSLMVRLVA